MPRQTYVIVRDTGILTVETLYGWYQSRWIVPHFALAPQRGDIWLCTFTRREQRGLTENRLADLHLVRLVVRGSQTESQWRGLRESSHH